MQINAIVVNYFTADFILLLVDILLREPEMGLVVIADNSGEDKITTLAKKDNRIKVMRFGKNIGFGAAVNRAAQAYPADWFLVINPDTVPDVGFLQQLLQGALQTNALIAGPRFFWDDNKLFKLPPALGHSWSIQYNMDIAKQSAIDATLLDAHWTIRHERFWKTETPFTESFLSGACLLIKNDTSYFQGGNLFDPLNNYTSIALHSVSLLQDGQKIDIPLQLSSNALFESATEYIFDTDDPQVFIHFDDYAPVELNEVSIKLDYLKDGFKLPLDLLKQKNSTIVEYQQALQHKEGELTALKNDYSALTNKYRQNASLTALLQCRLVKIIRSSYKLFGKIIG